MSGEEGSDGAWISAHLHISLNICILVLHLIFIFQNFCILVLPLVCILKLLHICFAFGLYLSEHLHTLLVLPLITYLTPWKPLLLGEVFFSFCLWFVVDVYEVFRRFQKTICVECWMDQWRLWLASKSKWGKEYKASPAASTEISPSLLYPPSHGVDLQWWWKEHLRG